MDKICDYDELKKSYGTTTIAELVACLQASNIPFHRKGQRGKPWTTLSAINQSLGINQYANKRRDKQRKELDIKVK